MKVKYITIYEICLYVVLILNTGVLNIYINQDSLYMAISVIISFFCFLIYLTEKNKKNLEHWTNYFIILILCLFIIEGFRVKIDNSNYITTKQMFQMYDGVFVTLLTYPTYEILLQKKEKLFKNISLISIGVLLFKSIVWYLYNFHSINIAPGYFATNGWTRTLGSLTLTRLTGNFLEGISFAFCITIALKIDNNRKNRLLALIGAFFIFFYDFVVTQSRAQMVHFLLLIIILLFFFVKNNNKVLFNITVFLGICILIYLNKENIQNFINGFSINNTITGRSTAIRINGMNFLSQLWKEKSLWWGIGFLGDRIYDGSSILYLSDYGLIVNLYEFGIIGFSILMIPFYFGFKVVIKKYQIIISNAEVACAAFFIYTVIFSVAANLYLIQYITLLPLLVASINYLEKIPKYNFY